MQSGQHINKLSAILAACFLLIFGSAQAALYDRNNTYTPHAFPKPVSQRVFSIPVSPEELLVVCPSSASGEMAALQDSLSARIGVRISFCTESEADSAKLGGCHLILVGNITNNRWLRELYDQRYTFADAYFPGAEGVLIHPAKSIWNREKNVIVVGVSRDEDLRRGLETLLGLLPPGAKTIGPLHKLVTKLAMPASDQTAAAAMKDYNENPETQMAPYWTIVDWAVLYELTGDKKYAVNFRVSLSMIRARAQKTGHWVSEAWTAAYGYIGHLTLAWYWFDDDPFFTPADRSMIEEVLWGLAQYADGQVDLDPENTVPGDLLDTHAISNAWTYDLTRRYYAQKYRLDLPHMRESSRRAFEPGETGSYMGDADASQYLGATLMCKYSYMLMNRTDLVSRKDQVRRSADLLAVTYDNRGDMVSFGDQAVYTHRAGGPYGAEQSLWSLAETASGDGAYQWMLDWTGAGKTVSLYNLLMGTYASKVTPKEPKHLLGIHPMLLDTAGLRWAARRARDMERMTPVGQSYFNKMSFRRDFDPNNEYLLLDGTSTFCHGHQDGNSISRLSWMDRVWLFDLDYLKCTPQFHNGVTVTRDGVQADPPPLAALHTVADYGAVGISRSTMAGYNGADWERAIIWNKGKFFLILDRVAANRNGQFRLDSRWRTRGTVGLSGNTLSVVQGDRSFYVKSADDAERRLEREPDGPLNILWLYPYGDKELVISHARKDIQLSAGRSWTFANLLYASDTAADPGYMLRRAGEDIYSVEAGPETMLVGTCPEALSRIGVYTDAGLFLLSGDRLLLTGATRLKIGAEEHLIASPSDYDLDLNRGAGLKLAGVLAGEQSSPSKGDQFSFHLNGSERTAGLLDSARKAALTVLPGKSPRMQDFGIDLLSTAKNDTTAITATAFHFGSAFCGDEKGFIFRLAGGARTDIARLPSEKRVQTLSAGDLDGDGKPEIVAGDNEKGLYCFNGSGKLLWKHELTPFFGGSLYARAISIEDIDGRGKPTVLVGTGSWKVYAIAPDGKIRWEGYTNYHYHTAVRALDNGPGHRYVLAGQEYRAPLTVLNASTGKMLYKTWEELGGEASSRTDFFGTHLTGFTFFDANGDGTRDAIFGTLSNCVYALNAADGAKIWEANVGGAVTALDKFTLPGTGELRMAIGTEAGDLSLYNRKGERLNGVNLGHRITGLQVLDNGPGKRVDLAVSTDDGQVAVFDHTLHQRGTIQLDNPVLNLGFGKHEKNDWRLYAVSEKKVYELKYEAFFMRESWYK